MSERKLAVFDVDGTIRPGSLVEDAFWQLTEHGLFTPGEETIKKLQILRQQGSDDYISALVGAYVEAKKGKSVGEIKRFANRLTTESAALLDPQIVERIEQHRLSGDALAMISGSPQVYIEALATQLGFDAASGSRFYHNGHVYHTQREAEDRGTRELKPQIALKIAASLGTTGVIAAYGDTMSDADMLALAEHPVAVHPTPDLRTYAFERGWEIID